MNFDALVADFKILESWLEKGLILLQTAQTLSAAVVQKHLVAPSGPVLPNVVNELDPEALDAIATPAPETLN